MNNVFDCTNIIELSNMKNFCFIIMGLLILTIPVTYAQAQNAQQQYENTLQLTISNTTGSSGFFGTCGGAINPSGRTLCSTPQLIKKGENMILVPPYPKSYPVFSSDGTNYFIGDSISDGEIIYASGEYVGDGGNLSIVDTNVEVGTTYYYQMVVQFAGDYYSNAPVFLEGFATPSNPPSSSSANNNSEDGTHPGTSGQTGTVSFVDKANDDFSLAAGDRKSVV